MFNIKLVNVGTLGTCEFELSPGMVTVLGPNGRGKSTLVDALHFALTGEPLKTAVLTDLITWGFPYMEITLEAEDYTVTRKIFDRSTPASHRLVSKDISLDRKDDVNKWLLNYYNLSTVDAFRYVYFAEQYRAIDVITAKNSDRSSLLMDVFGLQKFDKLRDVLQAGLSSIQVDNVTEDLMKQLQSSVDAASTDQLCAQATVDKLNSDIRGMGDATVIQNNATNNVLKEQLDYVKESSKRLTAEVSRLEALVVDIDAPSSADDANAATKRRYADAVTTKERVSSELSAIQKSRKPSVNSLRDLQRAIQGAMASTNAQIRQLESRKTLLADGKCPLTAGAPCSDLKAMTNQHTIDSDLTALRSSLVSQQKDLDELVEMESEASEQHVRLEALMRRSKELDADILLYATAKDFDLTAYEEKKAKAAAAQASQSKLSSEYAEASSLLATVSAQLAEMENKTVFSTEQDRQEAIKLSTDLTNNRNLLVAAEATLKATTKSLESAKQSLESAQRQRDLAAEAIERRAVFTEARDILHRDKAPRLILDAVRTELNERLNRDIDLFNFPYMVDWREDGSFVFDTLTDKPASVSRLSGGQQYVLAIIYRCVLADMLDSHFPLFVLDEPTTGLDVSNRVALAGMLSSVSKTLGSRGVSMLIPTHDESLVSVATTSITLEE